MRAGRYRHVITVQRKVENQSTSGAVSNVWQDFRPGVRANVKPLRGNQYFAAQQLQSQQSVIIETRYLEGYRTGQRIVFMVEGFPQYYEIIDIINKENRNRELEFMCKLHESDGLHGEK